MAEFLSSKDLGRRPAPSGASPIQGYRAGIAEDAAIDAAQMLQQTGRQVEQFGAGIIDEEQKKEEKSKLINDSLLEAQIKSKIMQIKLAKTEEFQQSDDIDNFTSDLTKSINESVNPLLAGVSPENRPFMDIMVNDSLAQGVAATNELVRGRREDRGLASLIKNQDANAKYVMMTGDMSGYEASKQELLSHAAKWNIGESKAVKMMQEQDALFAEAQLESMPYSEQIKAIQSSLSIGSDIPYDYVRKTAQIESGGDPNAQNPNSSAGGLFQFTDSTAKEYGLSKEDKFNPEKSTKAFLKFTKDNKDYLEKELGREVSGSELYLAHQQGRYGAIKILKNPDKSAVETLGKDQVVNNGGSEGMTNQEFFDIWSQKYEKADMANIPRVGKGSGTLLDRLPFDQLLRKRNDVRAYMKPDVDKAVNDAMAELSDTGNTSVNINRDQIEFVYGKDSGRIYDELDAAKEFGVAVSSTKTMPMMQHAEFINNSKPSGDNYEIEKRKQTALVAAYEQKEKQLNSDPFSYVASTFDDVNAAKDAYDRQKTPQAFQDYVDKNLEKQQQLGVVDGKRKVMMPSQAQAVVDELFTLDASKKIERLNGLKETYGRFWKDVKVDLIEAGMPDGMSVAMSMDMPEQSAARVMLFEALDAGVDLKKSIPSEQLKGLDAAVYTELQDYSASVSRSPNSDKKISSNSEAVKTLAMKYMLTGKETNIKKAAKMAAKDIVNIKYNYIDDVAIPTDYDAPKVEKGLFDAKRSILENPYISPVTYGSQAGISRETQSKQYREMLSRNAIFYLNEREDGVYVLDSHLETVMVPVIGDSGVPTQSLKNLEFKFDDIVSNKSRVLSPMQKMVLDGL